MSRPILLVFLLLVLIITSQFEWRQPLVTDLESNPSLGQKQQKIPNKEEGVKEKIMLSQERKIQRLNDLIRSLRQQLLMCRGQNGSTDATPKKLSERVMELERKQILDD